jgi:Holliday junction resolvase-like predicted endonuclease
VVTEWEIVCEACRRLGATRPHMIWCRKGQHSNAVTIGVAVEHFDPPALVFQVHPEEPDGTSGTAARIQRQFGFFVEMRGQDQSGECNFVRPIAVFPDLRCVVAEAVIGRDMWGNCRSTCQHLSRISLIDLIRHTENLGRWAGGLEVRTKNDKGIEGILREVRAELESKLQRINTFRFISNDDVERVLMRFNALATDLRKLQAYSVVAHGDLCPANVLLEDGETHVIDIHTAHRGLGFEDAAYFLCTMDQLQHEWWRYNKGRVGLLKKAFMKGYLAQVQPLRELVMLQFLKANVQMMHYFVLARERRCGIRCVLDGWRARQSWAAIERLLRESTTDPLGHRNDQ